MISVESIRMDAELCRKLLEVSKEAGQTRTMAVGHALYMYFPDYEIKQRILRQAEAGPSVPVNEVNRNG